MSFSDRINESQLRLVFQHQINIKSFERELFSVTHPLLALVLDLLTRNKVKRM